MPVNTSLLATRQKECLYTTLRQDLLIITLQGGCISQQIGPLCSVRIYWNETFENHPKQNMRKPESSSSVGLLLITMRYGISNFICSDWDEAMRKSDKKMRVWQWSGGVNIGEFQAAFDKIKISRWETMTHHRSAGVCCRLYRWKRPFLCAVLRLQFTYIHS